MVHLVNTSPLKSASLISFNARVLVLLGDRSFRYFMMTLLADIRFCLSIADDGRQVLLGFAQNGIVLFAAIVITI